MLMLTMVVGTSVFSRDLYSSAFRDDAYADTLVVTFREACLSSSLYNQARSNNNLSVTIQCF